MTLPKQLVLLSCIVLSAVLTGCTTPPTPYNYDALLEAEPRSILVIPPKNNSLEVDAPYVFISTISRPLGEKGYYVFPVAVIDQFMKDNGLPTPEEMNLIPLDKLYEHIGADAVLYTEINDWGQKFNLLSSSTVVDVSMKLVDSHTGALLWNARARASQSSDSSSSLGSAILNAVATQILNSVNDQTPPLSRSANVIAINDLDEGLLPGPYARPPKE